MAKQIDMETNKEKEINRICKTHIEANERLKQQLAETKEELVNCDNARIDWKNRAMTYAELIVSLNDILPNKQEQEITFAKVIDDVKNLISQKDAEIVGRKNLCYLRYMQLDRQDKEIKELKRQLALTEKALELACEDGDDKIHQAIGIDKNTYNWDSPSMKLEEEYKQQAKKEME